MARTSSPIIQISRKGLLIWIGLIVFISFWMFILGVMVGRGMAPVNLEAGKLEQELAELKARMLNEKQEAALSAAAGQAREKAQLGFYEALKNPGKETSFQPAEQTNHKRPQPAAAKPAEPAAPPAPIAKPKTKPPSVSKAVSGAGTAPAEGYFAVQVASVQDLNGADKLVAKLRDKGYRAYHVRSAVAGKGIWYRIRVGGFEDRGAAEKMLKKLKNDKYNGIVVSTK